MLIQNTDSQDQKIDDLLEVFRAVKKILNINDDEFTYPVNERTEEYQIFTRLRKDLMDGDVKNSFLITIVIVKFIQTQLIKSLMKFIVKLEC